jgi:hypothetical protein
MNRAVKIHTRSRTHALLTPLALMGAADRAWLYHAWERPCEPGLRDCKSVMLFSDRVQTRCDDGLSRRKDVPAAFSCAKPWPQSCDGRAAGVAGQARVSCGYRLVAAAGPLL